MGRDVNNFFVRIPDNLSSTSNAIIPFIGQYTFINSSPLSPHMGTIPILPHRPHCHITAALSAEPATKFWTGVTDQKPSLMFIGRYLVFLWNVGDVILQLDPFLFQHLLCPHTFTAKWYLFSHNPPHFSNPRTLTLPLHKLYRGGTDRRPMQ